MEYKFIFKGWLDFGNERSYENVLNMYEWKVTNHYKKDVQFTQEELFGEEEEEGVHSVSFVRPKVMRGTEKNFVANSGLLAYLSQYAISGQMEMWMIQDETREVKKYRMVEPTGDRAAISNYTKGRELLSSIEDREPEGAARFLDAAIAKYEQHAQAYERRAFTNLLLEKYHDAERDYHKSINIYEGAPEPHYGLGVLHKIQDKYEAAVESFGTAVKRSIPLQPIHWKSRRRKSQSLIRLQKHEEAAKELRFICNRKFTTEDPNFKYLRRVFFDYGYCQFELGHFKEASKLFDTSLTHAEGKDAPTMEDILYYRGMAKMNAGMRGYKGDLKQAAEAGHPKAKLALEGQRAK